MDADATENIPEVQAGQSSKSPGAGTLSGVELELKDEVNGGQVAEESRTLGAPLSSPRVTKTYGRRKSRGMAGSGVSTPTPTSSRLARTRSSSALQSAASKPRKRGRSPSPSSSKPSKAPKLPSKATVKRASSTSDLKEPKQPRVSSKPLKQKALPKPVQGLLRTGTGLGIDSDSELSELTSLSRSRSPVSEIEFVGNPKPIPPLLPSLLPPSQLSSKADSSLSRPNASRIPRPNPQPTFEDSSSPYVWVLIDPTTGTVQDDSQERLWWPGKIVSKKNTDVPLKVLLFGRNKTITISEPTNDVVRGKDNVLGYRRFTEPTYVDEIQTEVRESAKRETARKWHDAVLEMDQDDNQSDDDMPEVHRMFVPSHRSTVSTSTIPLSEPPDELAISDSSALPQTNGKGRGKRKKVDPYYTERDLVEEPDELLTIPGEMVFGREKKCPVGKDPATTIEFWAAKILSFNPPEGNQKYALYGVTWMTGESGKIPRSWFYSLGEDEFFTCRLGEIDSSGGAVDEEDVSDTDFTRRSPSPEPQSEPPTGMDFLHLPIRQQFVYTKPVLSAILKGEYAPLKELQAEYFSSKSKMDWAKRGSRRGHVTDGQANSLLVYLREWISRERKIDQSAEKEVDSLDDGLHLDHSYQAPGTEADSDAVTRDQVPESRDDEVRQEATNHDDQSQVEPLKPVEDMQVEENEQPTQIPDASTAERKPETDVLSELNDRSRSSSPPMTEAAPSSPPAFPPPSSLPSIPSRQPSFSLDGPAVEVDEVMTTVLDTVTEELSNEPPAQCEEAPVDDKMVVDGDDAVCQDALPLQPPTPVLSEPVGTPPRQQGTSEYEALLPLKKIHYMADFLLVEVIRQILLWRSGDRTSYELLSDEEEMRLFELGEEKLETDWVHQIMALRENRAVAPVASVTVTSTGKVLRGRKSGIRYAE